MELEFYLMVFERISTISALLAGFASTAIQVEVPEESSPLLKTCYLLFAASALGAHLLVVVVCTMCTMWGPGHALRGKDAGCVDHALTVLESAERQMEMFFFFGLISYFLSCIFLVCLLFDLKGRILVCSIFLVTLVWLSLKVVKIRQAGSKTIHGDPADFSVVINLPIPSCSKSFFYIELYLRIIYNYIYVQY